MECLRGFRVDEAGEGIMRHEYDGESCGLSACILVAMFGGESTREIRSQGRAPPIDVRIICCGEVRPSSRGNSGCFSFTFNYPIHLI